MPLSLFGFSALDAENWKLIEENFPVPIFNKQHTVDDAYKRNPRETSSGYRRVKGLPSSARAVFPAENQQKIVETIFGSPAEEVGLKSRLFNKRNNSEVNAVPHTAPSDDDSVADPTPNIQTKTSSTPQKVDKKTKDINARSIKPQTRSSIDKDLPANASPSRVHIRLAVDGSPLYMTPIKKMKMVCIDKLNYDSPF